jgi:hypothetical protein
VDTVCDIWEVAHQYEVHQLWQFCKFLINALKKKIPPQSLENLPPDLQKELKGMEILSRTN